MMAARLRGGIAGSEGEGRLGTVVHTAEETHEWLLSRFHPPAA